MGLAVTSPFAAVPSIAAFIFTISQLVILPVVILPNSILKIKLVVEPEHLISQPFLCGVVSLSLSELTRLFVKNLRIPQYGDATVLPLPIRKANT